MQFPLSCFSVWIFSNLISVPHIDEILKNHSLWMNNLEIYIDKKNVSSTDFIRMQFQFQSACKCTWDKTKKKRWNENKNWIFISVATNWVLRFTNWTQQDITNWAANVYMYIEMQCKFLFNLKLKSFLKFTRTINDFKMLCSRYLFFNCEQTGNSKYKLWNLKMNIWILN